jgi:hypothetical protein
VRAGNRLLLHIAARLLLLHIAARCLFLNFRRGERSDAPRGCARDEHGATAAQTRGARAQVFRVSGQFGARDDD